MKLWWYSRTKNKYEERTPRGIAHARHTYTFSAVEGDERYSLERAFSAVENRAGPALRKLALSLDITQDEHNAIAELAGYQYLRTPTKIAVLQKVRDLGGSQAIVEYARHLERMTPLEFAAHMQNYKEKTGKTVNLTQEGLVTALRETPPQITSTKEATLESLVALGASLAIEYSKRNWTVVHAPRGASFITSSEGIFLASDNPQDGPQPGPGAPGVSTIFPFSRRAALIIESSGPITVNHIHIDKMGVRNINDNLALVSNEIYGSPRRLLESIVERTRLATTRYEMAPAEDQLRATFSRRLQEHAGEAFPR